MEFSGFMLLVSTMKIRRLQRNRPGPQFVCICITGLVHGIGTSVQIYMTPITNVIGFRTPMAPGQSMTCFVNNVDAIANFLKAYYDKHVVIVIDDD